MAKEYAGAIWDSHPLNAAFNPLAVTGTNTPGFGTGDRELGEMPLVKSHRDSALIGECYVVPNMGRLPAGVVVARVKGGAKNGYVAPIDFEVTLTAASSNTQFIVTEEDAKYFAVGDSVSTFGEIKTIAEPSNGTVTITGTSTGSSTNKVKFKLDTNYFIIDQAVFSGPEGAQTSILYSNAVVMRSKLVNINDSDITNTAKWMIDGTLVIMK